MKNHNYYFQTLNNSMNQHLLKENYLLCQNQIFLSVEIYLLDILRIKKIINN